MSSPSNGARSGSEDPSYLFASARPGVDRTDWFLALLTFFVAGIALQTVSGERSETFDALVRVPAFLAVGALPFYRRSRPSASGLDPEAVHLLYHALWVVMD